MRHQCGVPRYTGEERVHMLERNFIQRTERCVLDAQLRTTRRSRAGAARGGGTPSSTSKAPGSSARWRTSCTGQNKVGSVATSDQASRVSLPSPRKRAAGHGERALVLRCPLHPTSSTAPRNATPAHAARNAHGRWHSGNCIAAVNTGGRMRMGRERALGQAGSMPRSPVCWRQPDRDSY